MNIKQLCIVFFCNASLLYAQDTTQSYAPKTVIFKKVILAEAALYTTSIYALNKAWYTKPFERFAFNDDSHEWLQIDKIGHTFTTYQIAKSNTQLYQSIGVSPKKAAIYGALSGVLFLIPV